MAAVCSSAPVRALKAPCRTEMNRPYAILAIQCGEVLRLLPSGCRARAASPLFSPSLTPLLCWLPGLFSHGTVLQTERRGPSSRVCIHVKQLLTFSAHYVPH